MTRIIVKNYNHKKTFKVNISYHVEKRVRDSWRGKENQNHANPTSRSVHVSKRNLQSAFAPPGNASHPHHTRKYPKPTIHLFFNFLINWKRECFNYY